MDIKRWLTAVIIVSVIAGWIMPVSGADVRGRLFVQIEDSKGKPIKDVAIRLVSEVSESKAYDMEKTDKKGKSMIVGLDPDMFLVTCEKEGYQKLEGKVKLRPGVNVKETWVMLTEEEAKAKAIQAALDGMTEEERNKIFAEEAHNDGVVAFENNQMPEAQAAFEKSIGLYPDVHYFGYLVLGQMAFKAQEVEKAQKHLLKAYALDVDKVAIGDIGSLLGATYMIQENTEKAKEIWTEEIQHSPNPTVLYNLAGIEVRAGNLEEAKKWLAMSVEKFPEDVNSIQLLGDIYIQNQDYPNALKLYEQLEKAMEGREDISPETLKDVKDTVKLLKETVK